MNGRDGINGTMGVPIITPKAKFEFNDATIRMLQEQVKRFLGGNGGQVPIADPLGFLTMCMILDRLAEIEKRLPPITVA